MWPGRPSGVRLTQGTWYCCVKVHEVISVNAEVAIMSLSGRAQSAIPRYGPVSLTRRRGMEPRPWIVAIYGARFMRNGKGRVRAAGEHLACQLHRCVSPLEQKYASIGIANANCRKASTHVLHRVLNCHSPFGAVLCCPATEACCWHDGVAHALRASSHDYQSA
jgi:hypothetical protein